MASKVFDGETEVGADGKPVERWYIYRHCGGRLFCNPFGSKYNLQMGHCDRKKNAPDAVQQQIGDCDTSQG